MNNKLLKNDESFESMAMMLMIIVGIAVIMGYLGTRYVVYPVFLKEEVVSKVDKEEAVSEQAVNTEPEKVNTEPEKDLVVPTEEKQTESVKESVDTTKSSFCVYHVQLGKFQDKANAEILIKELSNKNIKSYIINDSGYKVVTMPVVSYEEAEATRNKVKEYSKDAFVLKRNVMSGQDEVVDKLFKKK